MKTVVFLVLTYCAFASCFTSEICDGNNFIIGRDGETKFTIDAETCDVTMCAEDINICEALRQECDPGYAPTGFDAGVLQCAPVCGDYNYILNGNAEDDFTHWNLSRVNPTGTLDIANVAVELMETRTHPGGTKFYRASDTGRAKAVGIWKSQDQDVDVSLFETGTVLEISGFYQNNDNSDIFRISWYLLDASGGLISQDESNLPRARPDWAPFLSVVDPLPSDATTLNVRIDAFTYGSGGTGIDVNFDEITLRCAETIDNGATTVLSWPLAGGVCADGSRPPSGSNLGFFFNEEGEFGAGATLEELTFTGSSWEINDGSFGQVECDGAVHPGFGDDEEGTGSNLVIPFDQFAIIGYLVPPGEGGYYRISNSDLVRRFENVDEGDPSVEARVVVNNTVLKSVIVESDAGSGGFSFDTANSEDFDVDVGYVAEGVWILVGVGPDGDNAQDSSEIAFDIERSDVPFV
eukprot:TRINITY_DN4549_c0_g1_i1.p1 TRINITY_DN4549_c0_g1~~TRINITY_DN4549_c0_g1_i1.p1  ORF type:complete len:465 (+),score=98.82 TRINITY_DN4549_c0_g1_i1:3-1397(+)